MTKMILLGFISILSLPAFSQITGDCKVSSAFDISVSYNNSTQVLDVVMIKNGIQSQFPGVSFSQFNKAALDQNASLMELAKTTGINIDLTNSANVFLVAQSDATLTEVVDYIDINAQTLGTSALIQGQATKCQ